MDGNTNSATLADHRPPSLCAERTRHVSLRSPVDVDGLDYAWWDEPRDAFSESRSPLSVAGFVRLGELNRATFTSRSNPNSRGNSRRVDVDVLPPTHVQPSFRPPVTAVGLSCGDGHEAKSLSPPTASSVLIGANILPQNETPGTTPEAGCNAKTGATEVGSSPELNNAGSVEPLLAAA
jgi:hypothetical protein